jgi:hypothetical protein
MKAASAAEGSPARRLAGPASRISALASGSAIGSVRVDGRRNATSRCVLGANALVPVGDHRPSRPRDPRYPVVSPDGAGGERSGAPHAEALRRRRGRSCRREASIAMSRPRRSTRSQRACPPRAVAWSSRSCPARLSRMSTWRMPLRVLGPLPARRSRRPPHRDRPTVCSEVGHSPPMTVGVPLSRSARKRPNLLP